MLTEKQARNQLGTPGGAKSFLRGAHIFCTMSDIFKLYPTHVNRPNNKQGSIVTSCHNMDEFIGVC